MALQRAVRADPFIVAAVERRLDLMAERAQMMCREPGDYEQGGGHSRLEPIAVVGDLPWSGTTHLQPLGRGVK
jgi:hypothetical protein